MKKKRGNKGAPLVDAQGKDFMLEGRHPCQCEAGKHDLINNCLNCGRIVCAQEGAGECFTCGTYVFSKEERSKILSGSAEAKARIAELTEKGIPMDFVASDKKGVSLRDIAASINTHQPGLDRAIEHRDRLLDYDKTSVARSKVYDDQVDYFSMRTQNFISDDTRKEIQHRIDYLVENKFNREQKLMIDLEAGTVTDHAESVIKDMNEEHRKLDELSKTKTDYEVLNSSVFLQEDSELQKKAPPAVYIPSEVAAAADSKKSKKAALPKAFSMDAYAAKVQDQDMEVIDDRGMCLAMHQPYATLLVSGIKRFEGRTWFSTFKGRLWIYAAQKRPTTEEITAVETFYGHLGYSKFPHQYPTGAIVGCVTIEDCLPNEVVREQHPECEVDSPYAFVCSYPIALSRPLPVLKGGGNKIYKLESSVHKAVKSMLGF